MRDPSPLLVHKVRGFTRAWAMRRGIASDHFDDLEGDALEWLCRYEPPEGWDQTGAVMRLLPWRLGTFVKIRSRDRSLPVPPDDACWRTHGEPDRSYDEVDTELLLDAIRPDEALALIACATHGDAAELARREGVDLSTIHHRARRARAHLIAAMED